MIKKRLLKESFFWTMSRILQGFSNDTPKILQNYLKTTLTIIQDYLKALYDYFKAN